MCKILKYSIVCTILTSLCSVVQAQTTSLKGIVNEYSAVTSINSTSREVIVEDALFEKNDTVLLIQMTGLLSTGDTIGGGGKYEFHIVADVTGKTVELNGVIDTAFFSLRSACTTDPKVQLIRVPSYKNALVKETLRCFPWDGEKGGVLALMTEGILTLNADIDVSGCGFRGGGKSDVPYSDGNPNTALCGLPRHYFRNFYYSWNESDSAGFKGEGAVSTIVDPSNRAIRFAPEGARGFGVAYNGGGGGNGIWSGGGGGGNGGRGGGGDLQACESTANYDDVISGIGGSAMKYHDQMWPQRAFLGGGGGSGTGDNTLGGNGGGIVIIVAGTIQCNNENEARRIKANGGSVAGIVTKGGAGGGGAGGSVLLQVRTYGSGIGVEVNGGNGGNADKGSCNDLTPTRSRGAGGGGGGGLLSVTGKLPASLGITAGNSGSITNCGELGSGYANPGIILDDLVIPMKGFLHNFITTPTDTTVCYGTRPTIKASQPQKGYSNYDYKWQKRVGKEAWKDLLDDIDQDTLTLTLTLTDTTAFRRIVTAEDANGETVTDISDSIVVHVMPKIKNTLASRDTTVCGYVEGIYLKGDTAEGGNEKFTYQWEKKLNDGGWQKVVGADKVDLAATWMTDLENTAQQQNYHYRRIVSSPIDLLTEEKLSCIVTSDSVRIRILPVIRGNDLGGDLRLCENDKTVTLGGNTTLSGGDKSYSYLWQTKTSGGNEEWSDVDPAETVQIYQPEIEVVGYTSHDYRRIVYSGENNCCTDTSAAVSLLYDKLPSAAEVETGAGRELVLDFLFEAELNARPPDTGTGEWSLVKGEMTFADPAAPSTTVSALALGKNEAQWKVSNGVCPADSDQVVILVNDITRYSGFSPNNDGFNDCFRIDGAQSAESGELIIFNRHNNVVYRSTSFTKDGSGCVWDGRNSSGRDMPADTYYYQLTLNGNKVYKGYVVLKKE